MLFRCRKLNFIVLITLLINTTAFMSNTACARQRELLEVHIPRPDLRVDPNEAYVNELLQLIIQQSPRPYRITPTQGRMLQGRSIYEMTKENGIVDLMWTMTTDQRESLLIPIRIPIDKGLIGWRIALIMNKNKKGFASIKNIKDLRKFSAGQEHDWPDVEILKSNKLPVLTSNAYDPLFGMLEAGRFDYFPRSIFEVYEDYEHHKEHNFEIEQKIVIHFSSACYFFVSPRRPQLAEDLRLGFEKIIADGSFEKLFRKHNQRAIEKANVKQRTIIELNNPLLNPNSLQKNRTELWFNPQ